MVAVLLDVTGYGLELPAQAFVFCRYPREQFVDGQILRGSVQRKVSGISIRRC
jgi:hypothetical protein